MKGICNLCLKESELLNSHIISKFVYDWLKETSVTGYFRKAINPNLRVQDGDKKKLFCSECEQLLSKDEGAFASRIFNPYVNEELDGWGVAKGELKYFKYEEWLLRFVIGLQFRLLINGLSNDELIKSISSDHFKIISELVVVWRDYLLKKRDDTGQNRSYLIFLQNIAAGQGRLPKETSDNLIFYLLRSVDATVISGKTSLGIFMKLGPIVFITSILPVERPLFKCAVIKKKGLIYTAQNLRDKNLNQFILIDRPKEVSTLLKFSDKQKEVIAKDYEANKEKVSESLAYKSSISDNILKERISTQD